MVQLTAKREKPLVGLEIEMQRKGKEIIFGVRDGENIQAKCESQGNGRFTIWVGLLQDPGAIGQVTPAVEPPAGPTVPTPEVG